MDLYLSIVELTEQARVMRVALEYVMADVEANSTLSPETIDKLGEAGYEYDPLGPMWEYSAKVGISGEIDPDSKAHTEKDAIEWATDALWDVLSDLVVKNSFEEFKAMLRVEVEKV